MELKVTRYEIDDDGVATLWLDRPGRGNSWTGRMHDEIRWICAQLDDDPTVRVIVLTGAGNTFCAGADFKALDHYVEADHYDPSLSEEAANPGYGVRPEFDGDMVWQLGCPARSALKSGKRASPQSFSVGIRGQQRPLIPSIFQSTVRPHAFLAIFAAARY